MDFRDRHWLVDVYLDNSDHIVISKASQIGITEWAMIDMFLWAQRGLAGMYIMPTDAMRDLFVQNRIDKARDFVPEYRHSIRGYKPGADSMKMKSLWGINWKFIGVKSVMNLYEFPASCIFIDEHDLCNAENLGFSIDRQGAAKRPITRKMGNPSYDGIGIDDQLHASDCKIWHVKCTHCGLWQEMTWFENFIIKTGDNQFELRCGSARDGGGDAFAVCRRCSKMIDRTSPGEWIAKYPGRPVSGYQCSRLFGAVPLKNPNAGTLPVILGFMEQWLKAQRSQTDLMRFYNNVLGIPFTGSGTEISEGLLASCEGDHAQCESLPDDCGVTVAGADVGSVIHVQISALVNGKRKKLFIGTVPTFEELEGLSIRFGVEMGVIDAKPEIHKTKEFVEHMGATWMMCDFHRSESIADMKISYEDLTIIIDRTQALDMSHGRYAFKKVVLPIDWRTADSGDFLKQMSAVKRKKDDVKQRYYWDAGTKADHHRFADMYECLAEMVYSGMGGTVTVMK